MQQTKPAGSTTYMEPSKKKSGQELAHNDAISRYSGQVSLSSTTDAGKHDRISSYMMEQYLQDTQANVCERLVAINCRKSEVRAYEQRAPVPLLTALVVIVFNYFYQLGNVSHS